MDLKAPVEGHDGIFVVRRGENVRDWNGIHYQVGLSEKNVGAKHLSMNVATIPPGGVAYAHIHVGFEVMLYILAGRVRHEYGEGLTQVVENTAGDFIFIEPGVPHEVFNASDTEPVVAVVARSDASEWQNIIPYASRVRPPDARSLRLRRELNHRCPSQRSDSWTCRIALRARPVALRPAQSMPECRRDSNARLHWPSRLRF